MTARCLVLGAQGELPVGLIVLSGEGGGDDEVAAECVRRVRDEVGPPSRPRCTECHGLLRYASASSSNTLYFCDQVGPVAAFRTCVAVQALPKTRSGKTLRMTIKAIFEGSADPPVRREAGRQAERVEGLGVTFSPRVSIMRLGVSGASHHREPGCPGAHL